MWFPPAGPQQGGGDPVVGIRWVSPDYFSTLGIRVRQGRAFTNRDHEGQPKVLMVNEAAVRALWPRDTAVGKRVALGQNDWGDGGEVIGVVSDVRSRALDTAPMPEVYLPLAQSYQPGARLFVRSDLDTNALVAAVRREVRTLDPNVPLSEIKTMRGRLDDAMWRTRVSVWLLGAFAGLALLLTAIGIFGVMAQAVAQRTPEIGLRMALGAEPRDVMALVLQRAGAVTAAGLVIGIAGALGLTRAMTSLLYGIRPADPVTLISAAALLGFIALAAGYLPARRAMRVDPLTALRAE
jgi:putative ABC transport system permease protein